MKFRTLPYILIICTLVACEPENLPPAARVYSIPEMGDSTTIFILEGENSTDQESIHFALRYRWDTDANGTWDTDYSAGSAVTTRFTQPGYHKFILEVTDPNGASSKATDSVFILQQNPDTDTLTDSRDGQRYRIVRIRNQWWMAENLRFGKPLDFKTPLTNNDTVEFLTFNNSSNFTCYGSLYTWVEANHYPSDHPYRDICPPGWRIPTAEQWTEVIKKYPQPFDVLYFLGTSSIENMGVQMNGYYQYGDPNGPMNGKYKADLYGVRYWTTQFTGTDSTRYFTGISFTRDSSYLVKSYNRPAWIYHPMFPGYIIGFKSAEAYYVRCVKQ